MIKPLTTAAAGLTALFAVANSASCVARWEVNLSDIFIVASAAGLAYVAHIVNYERD